MDFNWNIRRLKIMTVKLTKMNSLLHIQIKVNDMIYDDDDEYDDNE